MAVSRVVLFNGGLKSTFLLALAQREGIAIPCHIILTKEDKQEEYLERLTQIASQLQTQTICHVLLPEAPPLHEPLLHMLYLVLHSMPIAKANYATCIYHGLSSYYKCTITPVVDNFVKQLSTLIELGQPMYDGVGGWLGQVEFETPLRYLDRRRVIRLGNEYRVPWELTNSCQISHIRHCGICPGCERRKRAFREEGTIDPTHYLA